MENWPIYLKNLTLDHIKMQMGSPQGPGGLPQAPIHQSNTLFQLVSTFHSFSQLTAITQFYRSEIRVNLRLTSACYSTPHTWVTSSKSKGAEAWILLSFQI